MKPDTTKTQPLKLGPEWAELLNSNERPPDAYTAEELRSVFGGNLSESGFKHRLQDLVAAKKLEKIKMVTDGHVTNFYRVKKAADKSCR